MTTNDLNSVNVDFTSSNCVTVTNDRVQSRVDPDTAKLSPFQDVEDIDFEDICDDDAPQLDVVTLRAIAALRSGLDFSEESILTDVILAVINSITSQATTPAEQALGKFTRRKLKTMDTWNVWEAGERKQLNQFHALQMFGEHMARPLEEMLLYFNRIGNTMLSKMDNEERNNVVMVPNKQLLYCMHSRRPTPLVSNILFNGNFLHLQLSKTSCYLEAMQKMCLLILRLLKCLPL